LLGALKMGRMNAKRARRKEKRRGPAQDQRDEVRSRGWFGEKQKASKRNKGREEKKRERGSRKGALVRTKGGVKGGRGR